MDHADHYAESFSLLPGQCFRLVISADPGKQGSPVHCPEPVQFGGRFRDAKGRSHEVESCIDHASDLSDWHRVNASITDIRTGRKGPFRSGGPSAPAG